jgi:hypothetical protein
MKGTLKSFHLPGQPSRTGAELWVEGLGGVNIKLDCRNALNTETPQHVSMGRSSRRDHFAKLAKGINFDALLLFAKQMGEGARRADEVLRAVCTPRSHIQQQILPLPRADNAAEMLHLFELHVLVGFDEQLP